nr:RNA polymerase II-associated protein 3 isoform X1 [Ipomoea batatas]
MARVPTKHSRDQLQGFEGLLNNLQDWELSLKNKDKKVKSEALGKEKLGEGVKSANELSSVPQTNGRQQVEKLNSSSSAAGQYGYLKNYDSINHLSSRFRTEDSFADANAEKELGNEFFKQKKFNEAIDCYSRSIVLSPTAVAYANRAMAYLKIKRFQEAEDDCTEALNLDDRYIKAYSRRSTARKELGKLRESTEDAEFALRLEPQNNEVKKQYAEVKALYEKEILKKVSGSTKKSVQRTQKSAKPEEEMKKSEATVQSVSSSSQRVTEIQGSKRTVSAKPSINIEASPMELDTKESDANPNSSLATAERNRKSDRQELKESVQELAARAASYAKAEAAKNIAPPNSAYQFEVSWRGLSGDRNLQVQLLKVTSPAALPQIFKNALSAPMLMDIARCIATFFMEDEDLAVRYLENLPKVPRFSMIIMCLSSSDKAELAKIWDEVFSRGTSKNSNILYALRLKYGLKQ